MGWSYYPDGKLKSKTDDGAPVGQHVVLVDNSDTQNVDFEGEWKTEETEQGYHGYNYHYNQSKNSQDSFTWKLNIPQSGEYTVYVKYPVHSDAASDVTYTIEHKEGSTRKTVDQTKNGGEWVSLGQYAFDETKIGKITLSAGGDETVLADAVKLVRQNEHEEDDEKKQLDYIYDANGNLITITDSSPDAEVDTYQITYTELNEIEKVEELKDGKTVHTTVYTYDANGNAVKRVHDDDVSEYIYNQHADNNTVKSVLSYKYDPMGQIAEYTKTGDNAKTETYVHDANGNVIKETIDGKATNFTYDRNRLVSATTQGVTINYNYDPFGRLDTVTVGDRQIEKYKYDGFDRVAEHHSINEDGVNELTRYTYDPLDRTASQTIKAGTENEKTTEFHYLGLSDQLINEEVAGEITKSYQYTPWGERLFMVNYSDNEQGEYSYYGYNPHTDVEQLTDEQGDTRATYGYTAYGQNDEKAFTGVDKPNSNRPDQEPYNSFRFNSKRWDPATKQYDMGFRNYDPGLNRFLTRDMYNGALADLNLAADPFTNNPYAFASGNPITNVEYDGHFVFAIVLVPISAKAIAWAATAVVATAAVAYTAHTI
jgi:RHS repeat-associated protein